ncbi:MAG: hypothetical protein ACRD2Z_04245 [Thermoanaerobaculia bacterium]
MSVAYHDDDLAELDRIVQDWRATADELADPLRREVLRGAGTAHSRQPYGRPAR